MARNYYHYANESTTQKDDRVNGLGLQKLHDKYNQKKYESTRYNDCIDGSDESYLKENERRTNKYRIFTRKTITNPSIDYSTNDDKNGPERRNQNVNNVRSLNKCLVNNQAIAYATELQLTPLRIKCNPVFVDKNAAAKFVKDFFKRIENSFRNNNKEHKKAIGFDYWWIDKNGELVGVTKDILLYVYLCDVRNYPEKIESIEITPVPPVRLPPQHAMLIKFVSNDFPIYEIEDELKNRYSTVYHIEEMNGTRRLHNRHIRMDIYDKKEYSKILNNGSIAIGGMLYDVDEYLPAPRILVCVKCNCPGHTKKECRLDFERCRRCGEDRNAGDHITCDIICHHCGGDHQANDYKCPVIHEFRRELIDQLRQHPEKLPPHIQMFIPYDCRLQKQEKSLSNHNMNENKLSSQQFHYNNILNEWPSIRDTIGTNEYQIQIEHFQKELDSYKERYQQEVETINKKFHHYYHNIQSTCLIINSHIKTQKEIMDSTHCIVNELAFDMNSNITNSICNLMQTISENQCDNISKNKLNKWREELKIQQEQQCAKHLAYINHVQNLNSLWIDQLNKFTEILNSFNVPSTSNTNE